MWMIVAGRFYVPHRRPPTYWFANSNGHYAACWLQDVGTLPAVCGRIEYEFVPNGGAWELIPGEIILCDGPASRVIISRSKS